MKKWFFFLALTCAPSVYAQTNGALLPALPQQFLTANGAPAANGRLCTSASGTNTPQAVFSDSGLTMPLPNPIKLNAAGIATTSGGTQTAVYTSAKSYRVTLYGAGISSNLCNGTTVGQLIWQFDNVYDFGQINGGGGGGGGVGAPGQCNAQAATGADAAAKITACAATLAGTGGIITAEGLSGAQSWGTCPTFPGTAPITLLLGVGTYALAVSCNLPASVETNFPIGSSISVATGKTLTVNGPIDAGVNQQIFSGLGTTTTPGQVTVYPQWWGATGNAVFLGGPLGGGVGCSGTATAVVITCVGSNFTSADVGKIFDLSHAGTANCGNAVFGNNVLKMNCNLVGTIQAVGSTTSVTLSIALGSTVSAEQFVYATPDDAPVQAALNAQALSMGMSGTYALSGNLNNGSAVSAVMNNFTIHGANGKFLRIGGIAYDGKSSSTIGVLNGSTNVIFDNVTVVGTNEFGELTGFGQGYDGIGICNGTGGGNCGTNAVGITNLQFVNCHFDYTWGIGLHNAGTGTTVGDQINNISFTSGDAQFNSFDGYNLNTYDGLFFSNVIADHNGTGGIEIAIFGNYAVENSHIRYNHSVGLSVGGFTDNHTEFTTGSIIGNDMSFNGNNYLTNTLGMGLVIGNGGPRNVTVTGNTLYRNHLGGINVVTNPQDQQFTIVGNIISSNGLLGAGGGTIPFGLTCSLCNNSVVSDNLITDENSVGIVTASRTSNVVTVQTNVAHNYQVGYSVTITGTPAGVFDGTFTVTSLGSGAGTPNATIFTFAQTGANLGAQLGGSAYSSGSGFQQNIGLQVAANNTNLRIHHNLISNNLTYNVGLISTGMNNVVFESDTNYVATSGKDINITGGESRNGLTVRVQTLNYFDCAGTTGDLGAALIACEGALSAITQGGTINVTAFTGLIQSDPFTGVTKNIHFIFNGGSFEFTSPVSVSIPVNVTIELRNGAHFLVDSGATLSIAGNVIAPQGEQIFFGAGAISFTAANRTPFVSSLWFGDNKPLQETLYFSTNAGGANNAWVLNATGVPLATGLKISVNVDTFSLQAGANTLNFNGSGAKNIDKATAVANLGSAVNTGALVELVYDGTQWRLLGQ